MKARTVALLGVGCLAALFALALCVAVGAGAWAVFLREPRSSYAGEQSGVVRLSALDLNGERDTPLLVARLAALDVTAHARDVSREGATLEVEGSSDVQAAVEAVLPPMRLALWSEAGDEPSGRTKQLEKCVLAPCETVVVDAPPAITGHDIAAATVQPGAGVAIQFTPDGALLLEALTQRQAGRRVVFTLDDTVYSAPRVQERISGGRLVLSLGTGTGVGEQPPGAEALVAGIQTGPLSGRWAVLVIESAKPTGFRQ